MSSFAIELFNHPIRIIVKSIPTILFGAITTCSLLADYALANLLSLLLENGEYGIKFAGMEQGLDLGALFGEVKDGKRSLASLKLEGKTFYDMPLQWYISSFVLLKNKYDKARERQSQKLAHVLVKPGEIYTRDGLD